MNGRGMKRQVRASKKSNPKSDAMAFDEALARRSAGQVASLFDELGPRLHPQLPGDKASAVKPWPIADVVIPEVSAIAVRFGLQLRDGLVEDMDAELAQVRMLLPLQQEARRLSQAIDDTVFGLRSQAWTKAVDLYKTLQRVGRRDAEIVAALRPISERFAAARRSGKRKVTAPAIPPVGPATTEGTSAGKAA